MIDYLREENRVLRAFGASVSGFLTTTGAGSPSRPRLWAARRWPRLCPLPHPLRFCAGTATPSQPSTMAARTGAQADLRRRRTSVCSLYAWHRRTRRGDIRACGAHSRTSNTDTKLLIYGLFQKGRVLAQDGVQRDTGGARQLNRSSPSCLKQAGSANRLLPRAARLRAPLLGSPIVGTDYESWVWRLAVC